jgi:hypothetical protein
MRTLNGTTEESHHGKSRKSHRIALGIPEKLGGRRAKRVREASRTLRNIRSLYVEEMTAAVENGRITSYRLNSKVTLELESTRAGKK